MNTHRVIVVHLRRPLKNRLDESRSDPFYEFGSFGCTRCHSTNLMHPGRIDELHRARLAFAQGGDAGFRLVHLTPPVDVKKHSDRCEVIWSPIVAPFSYSAAPLLVNQAGQSDFSELLDTIHNVNRVHWTERFSSAFRTRREPLPARVAEEMVRMFDGRRAVASQEMLAGSYTDTLPYCPNMPDQDREAKLNMLREEASDRVTTQIGCGKRLPVGNKADSARTDHGCNTVSRPTGFGCPTRLPLHVPQLRPAG